MFSFNTISLPIYYKLGDKEQNYVIEFLKRFAVNNTINMLFFTIFFINFKLKLIYEKYFLRCKSSFKG
jgi:hypothetical protein